MSDERSCGNPEARHGFAGARPSDGGLGAMSGPPVTAVILLRTGTAALRAEKLLTRAALAVRLIPVPRELSTACGVALRVGWTHCESALALLREAGLDVVAVRRMEVSP